jgi:hypothetical protein
MPAVTVPEQLIATLLKTGVSAISGDVDLLDPILIGMSVKDRQVVKDYWASNPPSVVSGYARMSGPFPCIAIVLMTETVQQDYVGLGQEFDEGPLIGDDSDDFDLYKRRLNGQYGIHIYAEHPDICLAFYRVVRRIVNVGCKWLIKNHLYDPLLTGAELAPDPKFAPDHLFIRRLIVAVEYEEQWVDNDALAAAFGLAESKGTVLPMVHEDVDDPNSHPGMHIIGTGS